MSNQSFNNFSISQTPSLDQLLDSLGFELWMTVTTTFVIPAISFIGIVFCSLSVWIFFQKNFKDTVFFYYRLLCIVYIIHLIHNIPCGLLFSPRYFPQINTYFSALYIIYYYSMTTILFHFEETLQMAILLTRMKIFNSFVNRHFSAKPWTISLAFFLTCFLIDVPASTLVFKIESYGS